MKCKFLPSDNMCVDYWPHARKNIYFHLLLVTVLCSYGKTEGLKKGEIASSFAYVAHRAKPEVLAGFSSRAAQISALSTQNGRCRSRSKQAGRRGDDGALHPTREGTSRQHGEGHLYCH